MGGTTFKLLLVEDDKSIAAGLRYSLETEGYAVTVCVNAASGRDALKREQFDLCLLDLTLPDGSGFELCKIAKEQDNTPVVFLTACDEETSVVMGLDMGADDYITKPFRLRELMSRVKSVLRRNGRLGSQKSIVMLGTLKIDTLAAKVSRDGTEILLTALEYRLLLTLLANAGQVLSRSQLLEGIWDVAGDFVNDNTLTVYIKRLREKLEEDPQFPTMIKTVRGLGYTLAVVPE